MNCELVSTIKCHERWIPRITRWKIVGGSWTCLNSNDQVTRKVLAKNEMKNDNR